jgi:SAM-dependent methyltransferase
MSLRINFSHLNNKFIYLKKSFANRPFRLLDIGTGNHSATKTKMVFPQCEYHGVDMSKDYNNSEEDFLLMKSFYEMDLTRLDFSSIPENYFDAILMVHVIEHLYNGDEVIQGILQKLKSGGYMYIEYPGVKSTKLPSMYGTLNFYDDPTHIRLYSIRELSELFASNNCKVLKSGTRRNPWFMMAMPFRVAASLIKGKRVNANVFWDVLGFAEYLWVQKK